MSKKLRITLLALWVAVLAGCASKPPLQRAQISALTRESSPQEVDRILSSAAELSRVEVTHSGRNYLVRSYNLQTGTRQEMSMVCTPTCIPIFVPVPVMTSYVVIQQLPSQSTFAWGTLEELSKDSDDTISSLMPVVKQRLAESRSTK